MHSDLKLYTFGYQGVRIGDFVARLRAAGVRYLVDVRELPLSRKPGFSKRAFALALRAAGIDYVHVPALGCPRLIRHRYRKDGDWDAYVREFLVHLDRQDAAIRELAELAASTTVCLVCFEADFNACHRSFVARAARRYGAPPIIHLTLATAVADAASIVRHAETRQSPASAKTRRRAR